MKGKKHVSAAVLVLTVLGLACGTAPTSEPKIVSTAAPQGLPQQPTTAAPTEGAPAATAEPSPTSAPTRMPVLGDVVEKFGYSLTAITLEDPANSPGPFYKPQQGKKLIAVEFIVANVSADAFSSNELYATLIDNQGFAYPPELGAVDNELQLLDILPSERVRGWAAFMISQDAAAASLKYAFDGSSSKVLQVGLGVPQATKPSGQPEPTYTPNAQLPKLGNVVESFGYSLSAVAVQDPSSTPGVFYKPQPGKKLVGVEFIVGNVSGETFSSNELYATLVDSKGFAYAPELGAAGNELELLDLNTGEKAKGWAGFIVPENATPASLKYAFGGSSNTVIQVGLASH